jgi:2-polyprenyl-3-methyl-5-hydroxy-6-metoxy-1,4-benzoquinol methylase
MPFHTSDRIPSVPSSYHPDFCDLCGASASEVIVCVDSKRGMTSDSQILSRSLKKIACKSCGLIRDGLEFDFSDLNKHYGQSYQLNTTESGEEHIFFTADGPVPRSKAIHDWLLQIKPTMSGRVLEVGCGQGSVLERLKASFPLASFSGIDLNEDAVLRARKKQLDVCLGASTDITGQFDTIIAFGVLEHVPSPTSFLKDLSEHLNVNGDIILGQPMQDVPSYDLFFVDHLHHFTMKHVEQLAQKVGLSQSAVLPGGPLATNFSLHRLEKSEVAEKVAGHFEQPPAMQAIKAYLAAFERVNTFLREHRKIAVFGTGEVFALLYAYSNLADADIVCGIDDNRDRQTNNKWPFPVVATEETEKFSFSEVLLTLHPRYNHIVLDRLRALGLDPISILEGE